MTASIIIWVFQFLFPYLPMEPELGSRSRRKTFTVQPPAQAAAGDPSPSSSKIPTSSTTAENKANPCNQTFVTGGEGGRRGGEEKETVVLVGGEISLPFSESLSRKKNSCANNNQNLTMRGLSSPTRGREPVSQLLLSFPELKINPVDPELEELVRSDVTTRNEKLKNLVGFACDPNIYEVSGGNSFFETTSVELPRRKTGIELEQLRRREKDLLDEIALVKSSTEILEQEQKAEMKEMEADAKRHTKRIANWKKEQAEMKAQKKKLENKLMTAATEANSRSYKLDIRNEFLQKFLKIDPTNYKCTDSRYCNEFHSGKCEPS